MRRLKGLERAAKRIVPPSWRKHLRASKYELVMERAAPVDLIVHVGAHWAEDAGAYEGYGAKTALWIEADPDTFAKRTAVLAERPCQTRHLTESALGLAEAGAAVPHNRHNGSGRASAAVAPQEH